MLASALEPGKLKLRCTVGSGLQYSTLQRSSPSATPERVACPDCGLVQALPLLGRGQLAECRRCDRVLAGPSTGRIDAPLAWLLGALVLLGPALVGPLLSVASYGARRQSWLPSGVRALWEDGFPSLGTLVGLFSIVLPCVYVVLLTWVLAALHFGRGVPPGRVFRWATYVRPWMMLEVYLVGCFVAYSRVDAIATVEVGSGGWALLAATFMLLLALTQLDDRTVWAALPIRSPEALPDGTRTIACTTCELVVTGTESGKKCPRCAATLHVRKPLSIRRTVALVAAAYLLYIPANVLPVLTIVRFGREERNTILSGVLELIQNRLWPLALIVFLASILVPMLKLCGLTWMLIATARGSTRWLTGRTRLYRVIDLIGRWSNIDVFMVSVLVALLQLGALTDVHAGDGLVAFAAVVILTMIATSTFDTRLMWDVRDARAT